jgi:hypothetical protein
MRNRILLVIGHWDLFGFWDLGFGISKKSPCSKQCFRAIIHEEVTHEEV